MPRLAPAARRDPEPARAAARRADLEPTGAGIEATREDLLDAAAHLFAERGYHHTTVEDVGAAAHVAKGTVYWYYRSKKALFLAVLERAADVYRSELRRGAAKVRSPLARLERAIDGTLSFARRRPDLCRLYFQQVLVDDADFVRMRAAIYAGLIEDLRATIREAVGAGEIPASNADLAARLIVGAVEAGVRCELDGASGRRRAEAGGDLRAFVVGGLTGRKR